MSSLSKAPLNAAGLGLASSSSLEPSSAKTLPDCWALFLVSLVCILAVGSCMSLLVDKSCSKAAVDLVVWNRTKQKINRFEILRIHSVGQTMILRRVELDETSFGRN
jgi:hypothetical protein